jgi:integrase
VARKVELPKPRPYDLRGSYVSLLAAEGYTLLEVSRYAGHSVQTCETYYAKIFDDVDPANRLPAEQAIRAAREPGISGVARLFDIARGTS